MFASTHKENFLRYVCGTMIMKLRDRLLQNDFGSCLKLLQNYPSCGGFTSMDELLESSRSLWMYESQITLACHGTTINGDSGGIPLTQALQKIRPCVGIVMAYGLSEGKAPNLTEQFYEQASAVSDHLSGAAVAAATATVAATEAVIPSTKTVNRMFGKAKKLWETGWGSGGRTTTTTRTTSGSSVIGSGSRDDGSNDMYSNGINHGDTDNSIHCNNVSLVPTSNNPTSIDNNSTDQSDDGGWNIIDSIIEGNSTYLKHRRSCEDTNNNNNYDNNSNRNGDNDESVIRIGDEEHAFEEDVTSAVTSTIYNNLITQHP